MASQYCNLEQISENFEGDEDILEELVQDFDKVFASMLDEIKKSLTAKDFEVLERSSHTLKGVISNFFCEELRLITLSIETKSRNGSTEGIEEELHTLELEIPKMIIELKEFCKNSLAA